MGLDGWTSGRKIHLHPPYIDDFLGTDDGLPFSINIYEKRKKGIIDLIRDSYRPRFHFRITIFRVAE